MSRLSRLANVFRSPRLDRALNEEMQFHIESRVDDLIAEGMTREQAQTTAARQFGNRLRVREYSHDVKVLPWLESLFRDIRFAIRILRKNIVITSAVVASLTLAIGACLAAFSLVDALILRPLPVRDPARLVYLAFPTESAGSPLGTNVSYPLFSRLRDAARTDIELFARSGDETTRRARFGNAEQEEEVRIRFVSGNAFSVLGVQPAAGRLLVPSDDIAPGASPLGVISHAFWMRRFGGDPSVVGSAFTLGETRFEIVGVAQQSFTGIEPGRLVDLWLPVTMNDAEGVTFTNREWNWLGVFGRLNPGVTAERARDVLQAPFSQFRREIVTGRQGADNARDRIDRYVNTPVALLSAANGPSGLRRQFDRPLKVLSILVALVLVIAVSNVANLFWARAAAREHEMALRLSIGASRARLVQQVLIEGALLARVASLLALAFARVAGPAIVHMLAPSANPVYLDLRIDWRLLTFLGMTGVVVTLFFALVPALRASRVMPVGSLQGGNARLTSRSVLPRPLLAIQIGFSVAILFVATLLLASFARLVNVDPGFGKDGVLLVRVAVRTRIEDSARAREVGLQLLERIRGVPAVKDASMSAWPLFSNGGWISRVRIPGQPVDPVSPPHLPVSPGFFRTMRIPILEGRDFETRDSDPTEPTSVIVSKAFVRQYLGGGSAVGRVYERVGQPPPVRQEVIGVVGDVREDLRSSPPPMVYVPLRGPGRLQVRADGDLAALTAVIDREVRAVAPFLQATDFSLQSTLVDNTLIRERLLALLSGFFGFVGLLLSAVGLYGVLSYSVVRRTREIGIRSALGSKPGALVLTIVRDAAVMTGIGIVAGLAGGLYLSRLIETFLYEVRPTDVPSMALPVASLLLVAVSAALPAARRTARLDPVAALRSE